MSVMQFSIERAQQPQQRLCIPFPQLHQLKGKAFPTSVTWASTSVTLHRVMTGKVWVPFTDRVSPLEKYSTSRGVVIYPPLYPQQINRVSRGLFKGAQHGPRHPSSNSNNSSSININSRPAQKELWGKTICLLEREHSMDRVKQGHMVISTPVQAQLSVLLKHSVPTLHI